MKSKTVLLVAVFVIIVLLGLRYIAQSVPRIATYTSAVYGYSVDYPTKLTLRQDELGKLILEHTTPFLNNHCDFRGDAPTRTHVNDFGMALFVVNKNVRGAVTEESPYMPVENFTETSIKLSPGFIDAAQFGNLSGFAIYEGAEGCGRMIYYFPLSAEKTLVVIRDLPFIFSGVAPLEQQEAFLKIPGAISSEEADVILKEILSSFKTL